MLQRRVSVMGPRIILRGAIPTDSYIGGSGHRPLFLRVVVRVLVFIVFCLLFVPFLCRRLCLPLGVFGVLKVDFQRPFPSLLRNLHSLGGTVLPWQATILPQEWFALCVHSCILGARYYRFHSGSNFLLPLKERYYHPTSGTSALAVLLR